MCKTLEQRPSHLKPPTWLVLLAKEEWSSLFACCGRLYEQQTFWLVATFRDIDQSFICIKEYGCWKAQAQISARFDKLVLHKQMAKQPSALLPAHNQSSRRGRTNTQGNTTEAPQKVYYQNCCLLLIKDCGKTFE